MPHCRTLPTTQRLSGPRREKGGEISKGGKRGVWRVTRHCWRMILPCCKTERTILWGWESSEEAVLKDCWREILQKERALSQRWYWGGEEPILEDYGGLFSCCKDRFELQVVGGEEGEATPQETLCVLLRIRKERRGVQTLNAEGRDVCELGVQERISVSATFIPAFEWKLEQYKPHVWPPCFSILVPFQPSDVFATNITKKKRHFPQKTCWFVFRAGLEKIDFLIQTNL